MQSLPDGYRALVIGASGALGAAFVQQLQADPRCAQVLGLHRQSDPPVDYAEENSTAAAAAWLRGGPPLQLLIVATGVLQGAGFKPEKRLADLHLAAMQTVFNTNVFGPALVLRHFTPLLDKKRSVCAVLSAKVGSIADNRLGGWASYRASKAALNMVLKTAAIELRRTHPGAALVALHPGTVKSALSRPFRGDEIGREPAVVAAQLLAVLDAVAAESSGCFVSHDGQLLPW